jgi:hypothetical protein
MIRQRVGGNQATALKGVAEREVAEREVAEREVAERESGGAGEWRGIVDAFRTRVPG